MYRVSGLKFDLDLSIFRSEDHSGVIHGNPVSSAKMPRMASSSAELKQKLSARSILPGF